MCSTLCFRFSAVCFIVGILPISLGSCVPASILSGTLSLQGVRAHHGCLRPGRSSLCDVVEVGHRRLPGPLIERPLLDGHNPGTIVRHSVDGDSHASRRCGRLAARKDAPLARSGHDAPRSLPRVNLATKSVAGCHCGEPDDSSLVKWCVRCGSGRCPEQQRPSDDMPPSLASRTAHFELAIADEVPAGTAALQPRTFRDQLILGVVCSSAARRVVATSRSDRAI